MLDPNSIEVLEAIIADDEENVMPVGDVTPETFPDLVSTEPPTDHYVQVDTGQTELGELDEEENARTYNEAIDHYEGLVEEECHGETEPAVELPQGESVPDDDEDEEIAVVMVTLGNGEVVTLTMGAFQDFVEYLGQEHNYEKDTTDFDPIAYSKTDKD